MQNQIKLLSLVHSLALLFVEEHYYIPPVLLEADEQLNALSEIPDQVYTGDRRQKLYRNEFEVYNQLHKIQTMRKLAEKYGLDYQFREILRSTITQPRYDEISKFGGSDEEITKAVDALEASGKIPPDSDKQKLKEQLKLKGYLTIREITNVYNKLTLELLPMVNARRASYAEIKRNNPEAGNILDITSLSKDINLEYEDRNTGQPVRMTLSAADSLSNRVRQFALALNSTLPAVAVPLGKKFSDAFGTILKALEHAKGYEGAEHDNQRVYTATLFALYKIAPQLNVTDMRAAAEKAAKAKAAKDKEEADALAEKEKNESKAAEENKKHLERAQTNYRVAIRKALDDVPKDVIEKAEDLILDACGKAYPIEVGLEHLDAFPNNKELASTAAAIRQMCNLKTLAEFEASKADLVRTATSPAKAKPVATTIPATSAANTPAPAVKPTNESRIIINDIVDSLY